MSGIKAHTLRIWEKRFDLLSPKRTETNIRYYADDDLRKVLNVSMLINSGEKISKIAALSDDELYTAIQSLDDDESVNQKRINELVNIMLNYDERNFIKTYDACVKKMGHFDTVVKILFPFLNKVGILWLSEEVRPTHEHFMTNLIRNKMIAAVDALPMVKQGKKGVLFLPENELHELGLILINYVLKKNKIQTYYLGQTTPIQEAKGVAETVDADFMITYTLQKCKDKLREFLYLYDKIKVNNAYFFENEMQAPLNLNYPRGVEKITNIDAILEKECA